MPHWFQIQWSPQLSACSIEVLELIPAVVAAALYGKYWAGKVVQFVIDNQAVVDILKSGYSRKDHLMPGAITRVPRIPLQLLVHCLAHTRR